MMQGSTGLSINKALKYLYNKGLKFYYLNFAAYWNSGYVVVI